MTKKKDQSRSKAPKQQASGKEPPRKKSAPKNSPPEPTAGPQAAQPQEDPTAAAGAKDLQEETLPGRTPTAPAEEEPQIREHQAFPVVGIGASAGGLEPLEAFFSSLPADIPPVQDMAFVVIQHLSPQHKSMVGEILKKDTDLPIKEIRDGMEVEPNTIYFNLFRCAQGDKPT